MPGGGARAPRWRPASKVSWRVRANAITSGSSDSSAPMALARSQVCTATSSTRISSSWAPVRSPPGWWAVRASAPGSQKAAFNAAAVVTNDVDGVLAEVVDGAGRVDLACGGAVEQQRVATVGAHDVIHEGPDVPFGAGSGSGPLVGLDAREAPGEPIAGPAQQVERDHARPPPSGGSRPVGRGGGRGRQRFPPPDRRVGGTHATRRPRGAGGL